MSARRSSTGHKQGRAPAQSHAGKDKRGGQMLTVRPVSLPPQSGWQERTRTRSPDGKIPCRAAANQSPREKAPAHGRRNPNQRRGRPPSGTGEPAGALGATSAGFGGRRNAGEEGARRKSRGWR